MHNLSAGPAGAEVVVLLHGIGTGASAWQPQIDALKANYRVVAPYLPGFGRTPGPFSLDTANRQTIELLNQLGVPVHICGLSLGALIALEVARQRPHQVKSMTLAAGFVCIPDELQRQREQAASAVGNMSREDFDDQVRPGLLSDLPPAYKSNAAQETSGLTRADIQDMLALQFDARNWIADIHVPALVICGELDQVNLPLSRQLAEALPNAHFKTLPNAGHVSNLDAPAEFSASLLNFLEGEAFN